MNTKARYAKEQIFLIKAGLFLIIILAIRLIF